jgi:hypothetical protein
MPELPEVEVCRRGLAPELEGQRIGGVVRAPKLRHADSANAARDCCRGAGSWRCAGAASICCFDCHGRAFEGLV